MKRLFAVLFVLFLVMDVVLLVYFLRLSSRRPDEEPPPTASISQSQGQFPGQKKVSPREDGAAPASQSKTREVLDELLALAPDSGTKKTILYAGSELLAVEGTSIVEDKATGKIVVSGLRRMEMSTGGVVESSADGELTYDPATGTTEITASSVSFMPPPKK